MSKELDISQIGLVCLTHENMEKPWILFEAGALSSKMGKAKVCPTLFGFGPAEIKGPLATFQLTQFTKDDFKKLISTINNSSEDMKLDPRDLDEVFEVWWPKLDEKIKGIMSSHKAEPKKDPRTQMDILIEILELTRILAKPKPQESWKPDDQTLRELLGKSFEVNPADLFEKIFGGQNKPLDAKGRQEHLDAIKKIADTSTFPPRKDVSKAIKPDEKE
jgi:hypothetical protein